MVQGRRDWHALETGLLGFCVREPMSRERFVKPAVVGSGHYLSFTACHSRPVRLSAVQIERWNVVECPRCALRWRIAFAKRGLDWIAVWIQIKNGEDPQAFPDYDR